MLVVLWLGGYEHLTLKFQLLETICNGFSVFVVNADVRWALWMLRMKGIREDGGRHGAPRISKVHILTKRKQSKLSAYIKLMAVHFNMGDFQ